MRINVDVEVIGGECGLLSTDGLLLIRMKNNWQHCLLQQLCNCSIHA